MDLQHRAEATEVAELRRRASVYRRWFAEGTITEQTLLMMLRNDAKALERAMDCCQVHRQFDAAGAAV